MKKKKRRKIFYYADELNDDFAGNNIRAKKVDKKFKYVHYNPLWQLCSFIIYYLLAVPIVWFYVKVLLRVKFVNRTAVKKHKKLTKKRCFMYGNHIGAIDAFIPNLISMPTRNRIVVSADAVSIKGLKNIIQMLGGVPVPSDMSATKNYLRAIKHYHKRNNITIYPEAHIWPYYTGVRPFVDSSFAYPVKNEAPTFAFFTAFTPPKGFLSKFRKANITVFVSDAIYPDEGLSEHEKRKNLRDKVYDFMLEKSAFSTYEVYDYIKIEKKE